MPAAAWFLLGLPSACSSRLCRKIACLVVEVGFGHQVFEVHLDGVLFFRTLGGVQAVGFRHLGIKRSLVFWVVFAC